PAHGDETVVADAGASGGEAVVVPERTGNDWSAGSESGAVELCFAVPSAGTYRIETTDIAPDQLSKSYWVYLDGAAAWLDDVEATPTFAPHLVNDRNGANPIEVDLTPGDHTLVFANREDGTTLDRVHLIQVP
ncbi:MAG: hypothetical protein ACERLM_07870, partial [Acidimicrobiales bacterium]